MSYLPGMNEFLKQCARHYFDKGDLQSRLFIFPNRRSMLHFGRHISSMVKEESSTPLLMPQMLTMNDFFFKVSGMQPVDKVTLLLELYDCYCKVYHAHESLDEFIFWGDVLLADFDDVDKYLVDPKGLFRNIADFKDLQDNYEYLTETQRDAIERFLSHFRNASGRLTVNLDSDRPGVKERFLRIWDILLPLYSSFREHLLSEGKAYEGMVYRSLAEALSGEKSAVDVLGQHWPAQKGGVVFIGLNALNECEKKVMSRLRDAGLAEFCWDFSSDLIKADANKSSFFLSDNTRRFPQAFKLDPLGLPQPEISVISVPSSVGQAKQIPQILESIPEEQRGMQTAIVLPDENLLLATLNSIPAQVRELNVTMGLPLKGSALWSLLSDLALMQMHRREKDGKVLFYHRQVWSVAANSLLHACLDESGKDLLNGIKKKSGYYVNEADFATDAILGRIFRKDDDLVGYLKSVILIIAAGIRDNGNLNLELDFAMECYKVLGQLEGHHLELQMSSMIRLLDQLAAAVSVPFKGEPLKGLQIMGPLESRSLDFDNLVILSCNEGIFPRKSVSSSFIPPELRKGFGLPTYEFQDAVWAYYFYRMIQRASRVWLLFDSRTEGLRAGEESRYIKQLELDFGVKLKRYVAKAPVEVASANAAIEKKAEDIEELKNKGRLSVSSIQSYLACPAKFYYSAIAKLKAENEVAEALDAGMIGNVFHKTMQAVYLGPWAMDPGFDMDDKDAIKAHKALEEISREYIQSWLDRPELIKARVHTLIERELKTNEVSGRNIIFEHVECRYVANTLRRDLELMQQKGVKSFKVLGLEMSGGCEIGGFRFYGIIDRMDSFSEGEVRIVDYKTGKVLEDDIMINDDNAALIAEKLFGDDNTKRPKIALQLFLYDKYMEKASRGKAVINSIYPAAGLFVDPVKEIPSSAEFSRLAEERLLEVLSELEDLSIPFERKGDDKTCEWCDFKMICGK